MEDKGRLLKDMLRLGVCFRTRLTENDLGVYAEMIDRQLSDREWAYAFAYFTGAWKDEPPKFMPTPQELIEAGRLCPKPPRPLTDDERDFRRRYIAAAQAPRLATGPVPPVVIAAHLTDEEWDRRRRELLAQGDELLHEGEAPNAK